MAFTFKPLPELRGTEREQLQTIHRYLFAFANELNTALNRIDTLATSANTAVQAVAAPGAVGGVIDEKVKSSYDAIRSLIIKNADTVYASMDEIRQTLVTDYVAQSEFGTFQTNLTNTIQTTAEGILQTFGYTERLDAIDDDLAGFSTYQTTTEQYIKIGVVKYNDDGTAEAGVVVGKNLQEIEVDGKIVVSSSDMYSCFTAERLSFWKNGAEQAYLSNETLYVTNISVTNEITIGSGSNKWRIDVTNGLTIRNVG